jgi:hypothetical protein
MGYKIFVTYKYKDERVARLKNAYYEQVGFEMRWNYRNTRVRDYVDILQDIIGREHINLGERDGESLEEFKDSTIETALKKKIFQSSVTIVMISKGMKEVGISEDDQWIPWEVSYSLREVTRDDQTSQMNAVLGVVLPDEGGTYDWYYTNNPRCNSIAHHTAQLFRILKENMFNIKEKKFRECEGSKIYIADEPSFIKTIDWDSFIQGDNYNNYIEKAIEIKDNEDLYEIQINL